MLATNGSTPLTIHKKYNQTFAYVLSVSLVDYGRAKMAIAYEKDIIAWANEQASFIRAKRYDLLDLVDPEFFPN